MELLTSPEIWIAFLTLLALELVLGVDNVVFISILANRLPPEQRKRARLVGLSLALVMRIILLFFASWIVGLTGTLFGVGPWEALQISGRDLVLILGGAFLIYKAVTEIHHKLEGEDGHDSGAGRKAATFGKVLIQIVLIDIVFSLDSVITAVGMVDELAVMIAAVVIAIGVMMFLAEKIGSFVDRHPTVKMLCLAFLVLIGATLLAEGFNVHVSKGVIYGPIAFAIGVEALNLIYRGRAARRSGRTEEPVHLRSKYAEEGEAATLTAPGAAVDDTRD
ncbi:TerC family protein [Auraticoccus monumenti]|uniref:Membrane protein TerC, possibly involved in tellurium resistance n=1 Tax=Auraticoccus monumenti TaxID=675864 RepID=A0A1G7DDM0_9ACTN|nr:TerC family protein [Auraticoccus monumenti]SDE49559.1 Membrane protein TerC, possibly involved in tellurium resistance [Auraticoccus monumenti]